MKRNLKYSLLLWMIFHSLLFQMYDVITTSQHLYVKEFISNNILHGCDVTHTKMASNADILAMKTYGLPLPSNQHATFWIKFGELLYFALCTRHWTMFSIQSLGRNFNYLSERRLNSIYVGIRYISTTISLVIQYSVKPSMKFLKAFCNADFPIANIMVNLQLVRNLCITELLAF